MGLKIGIVGLPNVGKSTTFNALTGAQNAEVANYPFSTIQPNRAIVPVPDERLDELARLVHVQTVIHATIEFVDIAGLVQGASKGEGLGNQFLGHIRDTAALLHIVRCFHDPNVVYIREIPDPVADVQIVELELALADLAVVERKIERLESQVKGDKKLKPLLDFTLALREHLQKGGWAADFAHREAELFMDLNHELRLLTAKPMIYVANVDEKGLADGNPYLLALQQYAEQRGVEWIKLCAQLEQDIMEMSEEERKEFLQLAGVESSGLQQVILKSQKMLGLISFFTYNEKEARAWHIPQGTKAPQAAGVIHTDFERGFIRAEVIPFQVFKTMGSSAAVRAAGLLRIEGKDYVVQDGDVIYFRFNV